MVMEGKPLIESVHEAIYTLYNDPDCNKKNQADRWLIDFQKSIDAWKVADQLLEKQTDYTLRHFGAQMIRNKIIVSFHELPQEEILSLHSSLMQKLTNLNGETEGKILTPLCVAIVDLSLQMSTWNNPIYSFLQKCNEIPPIILLEILRVFPEEIETEHMRLGANRRKEIQIELSNCAGLLNDYLKLVITRDTSSEALLKAIRCFNSWIPIVSDVNAALGCELIPHVFQILTDPPDEMYDSPPNIQSKLHDAASDLLCTILQGIKSPPDDDVSNINLISKIAAFENAYHMSVAREDEEKSINYSRIFSTLGEAYVSLMINGSKAGNPHYSIKIIDLILICGGHQDYEVSQITFYFWFELGELLYHKHDDNIASLFKPYVSRLFVALTRQVQMEPDHEGLLDESDDFHRFREKVCDLVRDLVFVVGSTATFCQIFMNMQSSSLTWDQIEANLFIMYAVAWKMSLHEKDVIPKTVESILSLPESTHIAVKYTAILILGELREWFDEHPSYLIATLEYLASNLQHSELSEAVAESMYGICYEAKQKLRDLFAPLSNILKNLHSYNLSNKSAISVIKGVVAVMSNLPSSEIMPAMKEICWLQAYPLQKIVDNHETEAAVIHDGSQNDPVIWLDRLAAVFRFVNHKDSTLFSDVCLPAFSEIQPVLFRVMDHYQSHTGVMERCCRCIRFAIRVLGKGGVFVLPALAEKLVSLYSVNGHSCFLYLGSILVDEYGNDSSNWDVILRMIIAFVQPTCVLLPDQDSFRDHPDIIDDLFRLCNRTLQRLPILFLRSPTIWPLLERGLAAVYLEHREANSSVMKFFQELFDCSKTNDPTFDVVKKEAVRQIFIKHGEALVYHLIHASVFKLPSYTHSNVAEVLFVLLHYDSVATMKWIESSVQKLPNQNSVGSLMASPEQIQIFLKSCENATIAKDISYSLRDFTLYYS